MNVWIDTVFWDDGCVDTFCWWVSSSLCLCCCSSLSFCPTSLCKPPIGTG